MRGSLPISPMMGRLGRYLALNAQLYRLLPLALCIIILSACSSTGYPGPTTLNVRSADGKDYAQSDIRVIELTGDVVKRLHEHRDAHSFEKLFGGDAPSNTIIGKGDVIEVSIWEASPPVLFGGTFANERSVAYDSNAPTVNLPFQTVDDDGEILVPFVGSVYVAGKSPVVVAREVRDRLIGKAHDPQAIVRIVQNETRNATVLGEVGTNRRVPLTSRGERVLDIIAAAGGSNHPIGKSTIQLTRGTTMETLPLEALILDPSQNVFLRPNDIVTVLFQPHSFIGLGAVTKNSEVDFEGGGISLAQAMGRLGGLIDERADVHGVFVYRLEDPAALGLSNASSHVGTSDRLVPVIYRLNFSEATGLFIARDFIIRDKDAVYVSVAPLGDLEKFVRIISTAVSATNGLDSLINNSAIIPNSNVSN